MKRIYVKHIIKHLNIIRYKLVTISLLHELSYIVLYVYLYIYIVNYATYIWLILILHSIMGIGHY